MTKNEEGGLECVVCHAVIPPDAKCCEHCETGFAIANEKWSQRYEMERDRQSSDDFKDYVRSMNQGEIL